ncbi:hypothetical protein FHW84_000604 [Dyella sp. SG562]|uniref:phospholipase effector Tle1 domain-containing protein n=2 Tax=unclassified Dyella TaxID=2634549 RepID=UPI0014209AAA|nr:DUF2235 domain-containing protein [Dyella sp. SG562]NII72048.1 hypothetical protein [Dyella sp. SG562]
MPKETHKPDADGILNDGVGTYPADAARLQSYDTARDQLAKFEAPVLIHANNPHERVFVAAFDGTGNDVAHDPEHATNVAKIHAQIQERNRGGDRSIVSGYLAGPGTQDNGVTKTLDGMRGYTYERRTEEMYKQFIEQSKQWRREDPEAKISVVSIGFSRGAEQAAGFTRLVEERGIEDPSGAKYTYERDGMIKNAQYSKPRLEEAGKVAQVEGLFDPVGTGVPQKHDRRPPPSVISGFQIIAADERRGLFKVDHIIPPGESKDGRFLGVTVAGAHSDIGGSYHRDGLAVRSNNLMVDYLNTVSDKPFLQKAQVPTDPGMNVVHRSEQGMLLYRFNQVDRNTPAGYNTVLVPKKEWNGVGTRTSAEPVNEELSKAYPRQPVTIGPVPQGQGQSVQGQQAPTPSSPQQPVAAPSVNDQFEALTRAAATQNDAASRQIAQSYAQSGEGQALLAQGQQANRQLQAQQQQQQQQQQATPAPTQQQPPNPQQQQQGPTLRQ